jgi:IPT/TIG domain
VPPSLATASVPFVDAADGGTITLTGTNFGPPGTPVAVALGGVNCSRAVVLSDAAVSCVAAAFQTVNGAATVTLTVGGQTAVLPSPLPMLCPPGMFGGDGERCRACPAHAVCYGGRFEPLPSSGYYRATRTAFLACAPPEACAALPAPAPEQLLSVPPGSGWALVAPDPGASGGANGSATVFNCAAPAYTGTTCSLCGAGYYRVATPCIACPSHAAAVLGLYVALVLLVIIVLQWAYRRRAMLKGLTVGIDFLQVMTMFAGFKFQWPPAVRSIFSFAAVFSFNVSEQAAPECTITVTFFQKWLALQLFPAAVIALIVLSYGGAMLAAVVQALDASRDAADGPAAAVKRAARLRSKIGRQYDLAVGSCLTVLCTLPPCRRGRMRSLCL